MKARTETLAWLICGLYTGERARSVQAQMCPIDYSEIEPKGKGNRGRAMARCVPGDHVGFCVRMSPEGGTNSCCHKMCLRVKVVDAKEGNWRLT